LAQLPNESWGAGETLKLLPSSTLKYQQKLGIRKLTLAEALPTDLEVQGGERNPHSATTDQDRIAGMIGRNVILIPVRSTGAHPTRQERQSILARIVTATLLER
jgi:hypothetical protein